MEVCDDQNQITLTLANENGTTIILNHETANVEGSGLPHEESCVNNLPETDSLEASMVGGITSTELVQCLADGSIEFSGGNQTITITQPMDCPTNIGLAQVERLQVDANSLSLPDSSVTYNIARVLDSETIQTLTTQQDLSAEELDGSSSSILLEPKSVDNSKLITDNSNAKETDKNEELSLVGDNDQDIDGDDDDTATEEKNYGTEEESTVVIDISNPIQLCHNSLIVVNGQKCVLQQNSDTGQLFAYPIKEPEKPRKKRGRPRKVKPDPSHDGVGEDDSQSQDASLLPDDDYVYEDEFEKGLVEKPNEAGEIVKRSARKRKKTRVLNDYETGVLNLEGTSEDEDDADEDDEEPPLRKRFGRGRGRPKKPSMLHSHGSLMNLLQPAKRGRGRPRRYGIKSDTSQTQAFLIQLSDGQTVMMQIPTANMPAGLSVQSIAQNIAESLQLPAPQTVVASQQAKTPVAIAPRPTTTTATTIATTVATTSVENLVQQITEPLTTGEGSEICLNENKTHNSSSKVELENKTVLDTPNINTDDKVENTREVVSDSLITTDSSQVTPGDAETQEGDGTNATAVIPLPENMVPLILNKQDTPIKIGLKASENDLLKLRCPKCDFQAYYLKQYQDHLALHPDDVHRCKCCSHLALQEDELFAHYKETHPKCICSVCNHTAEHPYMITRHMYRHSDTVCSCEVCGKTYKDHYILKMHMKMVHMPAEILFECSVCTKKFTRKAHLKRHLRTHDPDKPYKCALCEYRGCEKSDITKHMLIHEEPKHICEECGKTFRHIKNKELHVKRHKGQRDYKCGVCDFLGYTFTDIRKHIERKHSDAKIICDRCGQAFKTDNLMKEHQGSGQCDLNILEQQLNEPDLVSGVPDGSAELTATGGSDVHLEDVSDTTVALPDGSVATLSELAVSGQIVISDGKIHHIPHSHLVDSGGQLTIFTNEDGTPARVAMVTDQGELALVTDTNQSNERVVDQVPSEVDIQSKQIQFSLEDDEDTFEEES